MIDSLDDFIVGFAIGIRYRANFSIEDQLGKIADKILYSRKSFFNPIIFPLFLSKYLQFLSKEL